MIDIVAALDSVVAALRVADDRSGSARPMWLSALEQAGAITRAGATRAPDAAALINDPVTVSTRLGCTIGAALVWRALAVSESRGEDRRAAVERALEVATRYLDLVPARLSGQPSAGRYRDPNVRAR